MTKSGLVGGSGNNAGEGTRKRLKISVPHFDNSGLIKRYAKTMVGRCMNPPEQNMKALMQNLPKIWNLESGYVGKDLGFGSFQFDFEREEDLEAILKQQPFHFDYWMLSLARWQPKQAQGFPSEIPFWVKPIGIPFEFRTASTLVSIGDAIGRTVDVDEDNVRVQVIVDAFKELCFETTIDFTGGEFYDGEEKLVYLRYEKLFGYCKTCFSLCHMEEKCHLKKKPEQSREQWDPREAKERRGGQEGGDKHDDRARSFRGALVNGAGNGSSKDREARESRDYYGKGKGKVFEDSNSKWVRRDDKGHKRNNERNYSRGDSEMGVTKEARREGPRMGGHEVGTSTRNVQDQRGDVQQQMKELEVTNQEEGEIIPLDETTKDSGPSLEFKEALLATQAPGSEVISDPVEQEMGIQRIKEVVEQAAASEDYDMSLEEIKASCLALGFDVDAAEDIHEFYDEEIEDELMVKGEDAVMVAIEGQGVPIGEDETSVEGKAQDKVQGTKKRVFKPPSSIAVSSKMRAVNALLSPRKRGGAKPSTRNGEAPKQGDGKGTSNPKSGHPKA